MANSGISLLTVLGVLIVVLGITAALVWKRK